MNRGTPRKPTRASRAACLQALAYAKAFPTQKSLRGPRGLRRHTIQAYAAPGDTKKSSAHLSGSKFEGPWFHFGVPALQGV